ncbi:MAG: NAD(P)/FAD-dependent oxidoreductase [Myxococcota bacterium]
MVHDLIIVGAGFSGLGMAIQLDRSGRRDWVLLESGTSVGGTWRDNAYPGAACDVPSHLYSFSFEPAADWSHVYARQPEIRAYLERCVERYGLADRIRLGTRMTRAAWDASAAVWRVETAGGDVLLARYVVFAIGALRDPRWPEIPGLEDFSGPVLHSARWDPDLPLEGKRLGIVGTGASAVQIVPALAGRVAHQTVFQRTPPWIGRRRDRVFSAAEKDRFAGSPLRMRAERLRIYAGMEAKYPFFFGRFWRLGWFGEQVLTWNLRRTVTDPSLVEKVRPSYHLGCKRILASDDWYPTLVRDDVAVETRRIVRIHRDGVELDDGTRVPLDVLVCCTGFEVDEPLGDVQVSGERGVDLRTFWNGRPAAYLGTTIPGFPNAFTLFGPNTGLGHTSMVVMIEAQIRYVLGALDHMDASGAGTLAIQQSAYDAFVAEMDRRHRQRVWMSGCNSWYLGPDGTNFTLWPGSTLRFLARTRRFDATPYVFGGSAPR